MKQLTKDSNDNEIKAYFSAVLRLSQDSEEFPVNLDEVWPLVYSTKEKAVRALKSNDLFIEGVDYQFLAQNGENSEVGRPTNVYMLSIPCLEFFIARKVRPVFEVYRKVFHNVAKSDLTSGSVRLGRPGDLESTLTPLIAVFDQATERLDILLQKGNSPQPIKNAKDSLLKALTSYIDCLSALVKAEVIQKIGCESDYDIIEDI